MTAPPVIPSDKNKQTILFVWAMGATFVALVSTGLACFFFMQSRPALVTQTSSVSASPFLSLPESAIPGRYKWTSKSGSESFLILNEDHTFLKDGAQQNPAHRWEITRDAIVVFWLRSQNRLTRIERPGVYVQTEAGIEVARMERQE
jgi:hypothetical protein